MSTGTNTKIDIEQVKTILADRTLQEQAETDVDAWNAAIDKPGDSKVGLLIQRIFTVLAHGGLMYREDPDKADWKSWAGFKQPIAAALSHGGRALIQIPPGKDDKVYDFLIKQTNPKFPTRPFATHGTSLLKLPEEFPKYPNIKKRIKEEKGFGTAIKQFLTPDTIHFGINVALFGAGQTNPWSINTVAADGSHGHLYIHYRPPTEMHCGALLIGCEGSQAGHTDQFGHAHDAKASSSEFSPTGGLKWRDIEQGPGASGQAADTLFVDLAAKGKLEAVLKAKLVKDTSILALKP